MQGSATLCSKNVTQTVSDGTAIIRESVPEVNYFDDTKRKAYQ